ncbi:hypothetical protein NDU88_004776 [Pleurodeles waltl]|uniref:Uncharacterized protein n=1 Tax=Pleurodeles waltl TaxID=8319 RepID=A0AAV7UH32_PLEWA|nr:hypothetical protein NDU88_004776 [Pleurodeles waltl]
MGGALLPWRWNHFCHRRLPTFLSCVGREGHKALIVALVPTDSVKGASQRQPLAHIDTTLVPTDSKKDARQRAQLTPLT